MHTGLVRSQSDASNTTLHATRMPPSACRSRAATRVLWSLAVRNATPHDASTSLVPGVVEGARTSTRRPRQAASCAQALRGRACWSRQAAHAARRVRRLARRDAHRRGARLPRACAPSWWSASRRWHAGARSPSSMGARTRPRARRARAACGDFETVQVTSRRSRSAGGRAVRHALQQPRARARGQRAAARALQVQEPPRRPVPAPRGRGHAAEMAEASCEEHDRPQTLLPIVDCKVDLLDDARGRAAAQPARRAARARWPSRSPCAATRPCACPSCSTSTRATCAGRATASEHLRDARAPAAARRARASSTTSPPPSRPGTSTRRIASAKRILVGDLNMRLLTLPGIRCMTTPARARVLAPRAGYGGHATCRAPSRRRVVGQRTAAGI